VSGPGRYNAPTADGAVLTVPAPALYGRAIDANRDRLQNAPVTIDSTPLASWRKAARLEALAAAAEYHRQQGEPLPPYDPETELFVSGHQPELFHPGVWFKNFLLYRQAQRHHLTPLNLIIDTDLVKATGIRVPQLTATGYDFPTIDFDTAAEGCIYEGLCVRQPRQFIDFASRVCETLPTGWEPLLCRNWPRAVQSVQSGALLRDALTGMRRHVERQQGIMNLELPISRLAATPTFRRFIAFALRERAELRAIHNQAVADYRARHGLRSRNHPVPDLNFDESPFWVVAPGTAERRPCFGTPDGSQLRPRALMTTLYARVFLGVYFLHGIGGGKYDEVTDTIIEKWLGIEAPAYAVASATLRLPLDWQDTPPHARTHAIRAYRDALWRAESIQNQPELARQKAALIENQPQNRVARRHWFRQLQNIARQLRQPITAEIANRYHAIQTVTARLQIQAQVRSREFAWPLFPTDLPIRLDTA
jgi:hypothetical protein